MANENLMNVSASKEKNYFLLSREGKNARKLKVLVMKLIK